MSVFSERLRELREKKDLSQRELARILGVSPGTVTAWEVGRNEPNHETLRRLADLFDTTVDYLLGLTDDPKRRHLPPWAIQLRPIPVYDGASAGLIGRFTSDESVAKWVMVPMNRPGKFGVVVHGDSMEPIMRDGDVAVVDPDLAVDSGSLALVVIEGEAYVKRVYFQDGIVVLQSINEKYPPITIPRRKLEAYIIGRVVTIIRECF